MDSPHIDTGGNDPAVLEEHTVSPEREESAHDIELDGDSPGTGSHSGTPVEISPVSAEEQSLIYRYQLIFRQQDQLIVWALTLACLAGMAAWMWMRSRAENGLIEIDRAPAVPPVVYLVDINRASWPELDNLPGIGSGLARAIVAHREASGPFQSHEELKHVDGIGDARLSALKPFLAPIDIPAKD